ncbi:MAG: ATP-binding cassette domain-containing protein [Pseudomonadota bacterium]
MVRLHGVRLRRGGHEVFSGIDLSLPAGVTAIMGANGAGKSSLLRAIHGLDPVHSGVIDAPPRTAQGFVFQVPVMLRRSVAENIGLPLKLRGERGWRGKARSMADRLSLLPLVDAPAAELSGGERQRLAMGRALITEPRLLLLDEPTASLDRRSTAQVEALALEAAARGCAILLATHSLEQVRRLADQVVFVDQGDVGGPWPAAAFLDEAPSQAAAAYLGAVPR